MFDKPKYLSAKRLAAVAGATLMVLAGPVGCAVPSYHLSSSDKSIWIGAEGKKAVFYCVPPRGAGDRPVCVRADFRDKL